MNKSAMLNYYNKVIKLPQQKGWEKGIIQPPFIENNWIIREKMYWRIETKEAIKIVGKRIDLKVRHEENVKIISTFLKSLDNNPVLIELNNLSKRESKGLLAVSVYEDASDINYYIAVPTDMSCPNNMIEYIIPEATWAIFETNRYFSETFDSIYQDFYLHWLPLSGYEYAKLPDVEVYPFGNKVIRSNFLEVWFAIKKIKSKVNG